MKVSDLFSYQINPVTSTSGCKQEQNVYKCMDWNIVNKVDSDGQCAGDFMVCQSIFEIMTWRLIEKNYTVQWFGNTLFT